jgi:hypothetical protein
VQDEQAPGKAGLVATIAWMATAWVVHRPLTVKNSALDLPMKVGIAFAPGGNAQAPFTELQKRELLERIRAPLARRLVLLSGPAAIGAAIHLALPGLGAYRGASSLASGLFVLVTLSALVEDERVWLRSLALLALGLFAVKLLREAWTETAFFAGGLPDGVVVTPAVQLIGAAHAVAAWGGVAIWRRWMKPAR